MKWLMTMLLCVVLVEVALRVPLLKSATDIARVARSALNTLSARTVSDAVKEALILAYAKRMLVATTRLFCFMLAIGAVAAVMVYAIDVVEEGAGEFIFSLIGSAFSAATAMAYVAARKRLGNH